MNGVKKTQLIISIALLYSLTTFAQISPIQLKEFILNRYINTVNTKYITEIKEFYKQLNFKTVWIQKDNTINRETIFNNLQLSAGMGLQEKDYQFNYIQFLRNNTDPLQNTADSIEADIRITDAAIHFYLDIANGNQNPALAYDGIKYLPNSIDITILLADYIQKDRLPLLLNQLTSPSSEISAIEKKLKKIYTIISKPEFREVVITSKKADSSNIPLLIKLFQLGIADSVDKSISENTLIQKIKEAQQQFNLLEDGVLRSTFMQELNVPLSVRFHQLTIAINYYRWLSSFSQNQSVIVVNIPAANLKVFKRNKVILEMRIIVGKKSTPTPTLASTVTEVILYPYWHVPYNIATKELLPHIKQNPDYVNAGNYQILDKAGNIVDPHSVDWHLLSAAYFPYTIRQSTGCDNALGLLKLNFYSPFGVYLHDTPNKALFTLNKRYFSHGCMRMENPMELSHLILKNNAIAIDTLEQKGCLKNQKPITVQAEEQMPVIVWYNPIDVDSTGHVIFNEDVYEKFTGKK